MTGTIFYKCLQNINDIICNPLLNCLSVYSVAIMAVNWL